MSQQCTGCCNNESCCLNVGCAQAVDLGWLFNRTALKQNDWPLLWVSIADNSKHWVLSAHHWTNSAYASSWVSRGVVVHENLLKVWLEIPQKFLGACVSAVHFQVLLELHLPCAWLMPRLALLYRLWSVSLIHKYISTYQCHCWHWWCCCTLPVGHLAYSNKVPVWPRFKCFQFCFSRWL